MMLKVQEIREIIKLIDQSSINEFTYETEGTTVSLKKSDENLSPLLPEKRVTENTQVQEKLVKETASVIKQSEKQETVEVKEDKQNNDSKNNGYEIVSPMVGTFYAAPSPDSGPYVEKGSKVDNSTIVCIVEAMKLFNEIEAEVSGEIVEILAEDGELVEYGQPLFRVK